MHNEYIRYDEVGIDNDEGCNHSRNDQTSVNQKYIRKKKDQKKFEDFAGLFFDHSIDRIDENNRSPEVNNCGLHFTVLTQKNENESWA